MAYPFGLVAPMLCIYLANVLLKPKLAAASGTGLELREMAVRNPQVSIGAIYEIETGRVRFLDPAPMCSVGGQPSTQTQRAPTAGGS